MESVELDWKRQHRVVPSKFPPINLFEELVDADLLEEVWFLESLTNDRLRDLTGDIRLVAPEDRVVGPGSTVVMAAFTHVGNPSRFSDGSFGVYYAAREMETAIRETAFSRARFLASTREEPCRIDMRVYIGQVDRPMVDVRHSAHDRLHLADDWRPSQAFGKEARTAGSWGIVYRSVRHPGGECIAALRPPAVSIPFQGPHLEYEWDGNKIAAVYEKRGPLVSF